MPQDAVIGGVVALVALAIHGSLYLTVKTDGDLQKRARTFVRRLWGVLFAVTVVSLRATISVRPDTLANYHAYPIMFVIPVAVLLSLGGIIHFCRAEADRKAFSSSCIYLSAMLVTSPSRMLSSDRTPSELAWRGGDLACCWRLFILSSCTACSGEKSQPKEAAMDTEKH